MTFDQPLLGLAVVLLAGIVGGELFGRLHLPKVTGWIGTGIMLREAHWPGLEPSSLTRFAPFTDFVLGFIAFTIGATLHMASLRNARVRLVLLLLFELLITPTVVVAILVTAGGLDLRVALILGAIAIAGAPGTTILVVGEARAKGILSRTLIAAVGLIDMVAVAVFVLTVAWLRHPAEDLSAAIFAANAAALEFALAITIALGAAFTIVVLARTVVGPAFVGPSMVALILAAWGLGQVFGVSSILTCTFAGVAISNIQHDMANVAEAYLQPLSGVLFAGFYTFAGMRLDFGLVGPVIGLVMLYFTGRLFGKSIASYLAMHLAGVTTNVRRYLGLALIPHGGVAVGLLFLVQADPTLADIQPTVVAVGLATLAVNQLIGPSATRFALERAGEAGQDRPRLLDFLREDRIVVGLRGTNKREIIEELSARLYQNSSMKVPEAEFLDAVMSREYKESTCLGEGFMIPHAILEHGDDIEGVLGISHEGLDLGAYDGRKIHAVVLLATPPTDRTRHLQILAAFATAITRDRSFREQLYYARSPAHAYEVLHSDTAVDINYFLDDAIQDAAERQDTAQIIRRS